MSEDARSSRKAGQKQKIVSPASGQIQGMHHADKRRQVRRRYQVKDARSEFRCADGFKETGESDQLQLTDAAAEFQIPPFLRNGKRSAAICHAPWVLIDAGWSVERTSDFMAGDQNRSASMRRKLGWTKIGGR